MASNLPWDWQFRVYGEPGTKANGRRIVTRGKVKKLLKSEKTTTYIEEHWDQQIIKRDPLLEGDLAIRLHVYYASRRPDLSALELIKDLLEGVAYKNDRQIKCEAEMWNKAKLDPMVDIGIRKIPVSGLENYSHFYTFDQLIGEYKPEDEA